MSEQANNQTEAPGQGEGNPTQQKIDEINAKEGKKEGLQIETENPENSNDTKNMSPQSKM